METRIIGTLKKWLGLGESRNIFSAVLFYIVWVVIFSLIYSKINDVVLYKTGKEIGVFLISPFLAILFGYLCWQNLKNREIQERYYLVVVAIVLTFLGSFFFGLMVLAYVTTLRKDESIDTEELATPPASAMPTNSAPVNQQWAYASSLNMFSTLRILWGLLLIPVSFSLILLAFGVPGNMSNMPYIILFFSWGLAPFSLFFASVGSWLFLLGEPALPRKRFANRLTYLPFINILAILLTLPFLIY